jgi:hypothetical protein
MCVVFRKWALSWMSLGALLVDFRCFWPGAGLCVGGELFFLVVLFFGRVSGGVWVALLWGVACCCFGQWGVESGRGHVWGVGDS